VEKDAELAVYVLFVAEGVLNFGLVTGCGAGEVVVAHSNRNWAVQLSLVVFEHDLRPALAAIDGKTGILEVAALHRLVPYEVRQGIVGAWPELGL